jgi:CheY-like chemotaxis protein
LPETYAAEVQPSVVIVDDNLLVRELLVSTFEDEGYRAYQAEDGRDALDLVALISPDVIVMDLAMPILDGVAATAIIRGSLCICAIPVIALSGLPDLAEDTLFDCLLSKPVSPLTVVAAANDLIRNRSRCS